VKENYYFDNAATTWPKPEPVYEFMDSFFRSHGVNPGRGGHTLAVEAEQMVTGTRKMLAQFFGFSGDPNRVVFTRNITDSMNMVFSGLLSAGDHVVISELDHNAVSRPANHMQRDMGVDVSLIGIDANGTLDLDALQSSINAKTKAVVVNHASNVIGVVQDLDAVSAITKKHGVLLIVDTAQTAGVLDINMDNGIDILTFTGHKGLFGPMGIGGMIVAENVDLSITRFGGTGVDSKFDFQPEAYPHCLEVGTISIPGVAGLHAAQKWFADLGKSLNAAKSLNQTENIRSSHTDHSANCRLARQHVHQTESAHAEKIWDHLQTIERISLMGVRCDKHEYVATLSFSTDGMSAQQLADMLDADYHICTRAGLHCAPAIHGVFGTADEGGALRLSPGYFTEEQDVDHLLDSITQLLQ